MKRIMSKLLVVGIILMGIATHNLMAVTKSTLILGNVIGTGATTLIRGLAQGQVHNFKDVVKCLIYGSVSGYGFYQSKKLIANNNTFAGVILANLSASIIDNITSGEGPISYIGFSLPLTRIEIATPFAKQKRSLIRITVSPRDAISMILSLSKSDRVSFRNGMLSFESDKPIDNGVRGWAYGMFPTTVTGMNESVYRHEMVHVVQSLQLMAASPEPFLKKYRREKGKSKIFEFSGFRTQTVGLVNDFTLAKLQTYNKYWKEAEAYSLVESL